MLRGLLWLAQILLAALIVYNLAVALAGWRQPKIAVAGPRERRFRIAVPAHNEEAVIASLIGDLRNQSYRPDLFTVSVLADRCTDQTAAKARAAGAQVLERTDGPDGKGAVLRWFLEAQPLAAEEALVVVDADNRVPVEFLQRLSDEIDDGGQVLQAYLDVSNQDASPIATASALSYWASNRMVQLARRNLGWTADLGGTGMCITETALAVAGGFGDSLVEDQELGVRLFLAGHQVRWLHDVRISDEKPAGAGVAIRQRSRWVAGRRHVARVYLGRLLRRRSPASWDLALRLIQPSRMGVALLSALLALASGLAAPLWPWWLWAAIALVQILAPIPFLLRDHVPGRYVLRYPLLVLLPLMKLPARLLPARGWYHTPHEGDR
ncbi:MAG TPA: glycosyltransferase [Acidimicrobiia bacterium]|nr:glycosyltransferase [Acidimicrobiia bacterium]